MLIKLIKQSNRWLERNRLASYLLVFLFSFLWFSSLQQTSVFPDPDSFYHIKVAQLIGQHGQVESFPWLQLTSFKDGYVDHHFLYHLIMAPLTLVLPAPVAGKLLQAVLGALVFLTFFWLLTKFRIKNAFWLIWFLLLPTAFVFRLSLVKAQPLSLIILLLAVYLILQRRHFWLMCLAFIYVWTYDGWFILLIFTFIYLIVFSLEAGLRAIKESRLQMILIRWRLIEPHLIKKFIKEFFKNLFCWPSWRLLLSVAIGLILGIIINPYFPHNLSFYYLHIIQVGLVNYQSQIGVGAEWYPYNFNDFIKNTALPLVAFLLAIIILVDHYPKFNLPAKYLGVIAFMFLLAVIRSRRNIEYFIPFAWLFAVAVLAGFLRLKENQRLLKILCEEIWQSKIVKRELSALILLALVLVFAYAHLGAKNSLAKGWNTDYLSGASQFLKNNSQPGDIVFNSDWDEFPPLFFHNDKNYYLTGLDPTFTYLYDRDAYNKWRDLTEGKRYNEMYEIVKNGFQAKYLLVSSGHDALENNLKNNFYFKKVYQDKEATIYQIL